MEDNNFSENYYGYVYITIDQKYKKVYVGQKKGRVEDSINYFGSGTIIKDIKKYRGTFFLKKIILGVCDTKEELLECETECKLFFNALNPLYGYNIKEKDTEGTVGKKPWNKGLTKEIDKRVRNYAEKGSKTKKENPKSAWNKGLTKETDDRVKKYSEKKEGVPRSEETKQKLRKPKSEEGRKNIALTHAKGWNAKEKHPLWGKKHSKKSKKKMSISQKKAIKKMTLEEIQQAHKKAAETNKIRKAIKKINFNELKNLINNEEIIYEKLF